MEFRSLAIHVDSVDENNDVVNGEGVALDMADETKVLESLKASSSLDGIEFQLTFPLVTA